jgi:hypothetical protein
MTNETNDEQAPPSSGTNRVLTSEGKKEAQAYAVAELHDSTRPTVEMERVQYTDPRKQITVKTARPVVPPMPPIGSPRVPDFDDELGVRPTLVRDDGSDRPTIERPTLVRDDGGDHPTIPLVAKAPPVRAVAAAPRRSTVSIGAATIALIVIAGALIALAPRRHAPEAAPAPSVAATTPTAVATPTPVDTTPAPSAAPTETATPTETAAPAEHAPAPSARPQAARPTAAAKPSAAPRAAPAPTATTPAKGRLFGIEN